MRLRLAFCVTVASFVGTVSSASVLLPATGTPQPKEPSGGACLLTSAEVGKIVGPSAYMAAPSGSETSPGEYLCMYGAIRTTIYRNPTPARLDQILKVSRQWAPVPGVGDAAYLAQPGPYGAELYTRVGPHVVNVRSGPFVPNVEAVRSATVDLARALVDKLRPTAGTADTSPAPSPQRASTPSSSPAAATLPGLANFAGRWLRTELEGEPSDVYLAGHFADLDPLVVTVEGSTFTLSDSGRSRVSSYQLDGIAHPYSFQNRGGPTSKPIGRVTASSDGSRVVLELFLEPPGIVKSATARRVLWLDPAGNLVIETTAKVRGYARERSLDSRATFVREKRPR